MKKFSKKGVLLFAGAMAVCAFAMPSMASAADWGVVGSHHTLTSTGIGFTAPANGLVSNCTSNRFTTTVDSTSNMTITTGTFGGLCTSTIPGSTIDCTTTAKGTGFPWRATARTTTIIDIHNIHIDILFEDMPGRAGSCSPLTGGTTTLTGTLTNGHWGGNTASPVIRWTSGPGLHSSTAGPVTVAGNFTDTAAVPLTVTN